MIYHTIYEIRYRVPKRYKEKITFSFVKEFLNGNEIEESVFWEISRTLEIEVKTIVKPSEKENSFFLPRK